MDDYPRERNGVEGGPNIDRVVAVLSYHGEAFEQNGEPHSEYQGVFGNVLV